jgi:ABC-2 type transport system ATP-binding protein
MSSGQKKKIMIMQSLLHEPNLLIMDEPTENLDPDTREIFYKVIKKLKKQNRTIFISTHNLDEVQNFADFIVIIVKGKIKKVCYHKQGIDLHHIYNRYKPKVSV